MKVKVRRGERTRHRSRMKSTTTAGNLSIPSAISIRSAHTPSPVGTHSPGPGRPITALALTIYLPTSSWPKSSFQQRTSCQRWKAQTTAPCGRNYAALCWPAPSLPLSVPATCQSLRASSRNSLTSWWRWTRSPWELSPGIRSPVLRRPRKSGRT